jgi:hypothetical protein
MPSSEMVGALSPFFFHGLVCRHTLLKREVQLPKTGRGTKEVTFTLSSGKFLADTKDIIFEKLKIHSTFL